MTLRCELIVEVWAPISTLMPVSRLGTDSGTRPLCRTSFQNGMCNKVPELEACFCAWAARLEHQNRSKNERHVSAHLSLDVQRLHLDYLDDKQSDLPPQEPQ